MAELIIPVAQMPDTIRYLANGLRPLKLKPDEINYVDWSCSLNYTIPMSCTTPNSDGNLIVREVLVILFK